MTLAVPAGNFPPDWFDNQGNGLYGPDVASVAGVITLPYRYQIVSGALAVTGIALPAANWSGVIGVFPTGAFTWTNATNIAVAGTAVVSRYLEFVYNPVTAKFYPSYV